MYVDQSVKLELDLCEKISMNGRGVRHGSCLSPILFNVYSEGLNKEALEGVERLQNRQTIRTVKFVDDLVVLAKAETVLQGMTDAMEWKQMWKN